MSPRTRNWTWEKWSGESELHNNTGSTVCSPTHLTAGEKWFVVEKAVTGNRRKREERTNCKHPRPVNHGEWLEGGDRKGRVMVPFLSISRCYIVWCSCQA